MLYSLSENRKAPAIFCHTFKSGIPFWSLLMVMAVALVTYGMSFIHVSVFSTLIQALTVGGCINWLIIAIGHYRFRRAYIAQGYDLGRLKYYASCYPFGPIIVFVTCIFIAACANIGEFQAGAWGTAVLKYSTVITIFTFYIVWKLVKKTKLIPLLDIDLKTSANLKPIAESDALEEAVLSGIDAI
jgi:lysine-specific permease